MNDTDKDIMFQYAVHLADTLDMLECFSKDVRHRRNKVAQDLNKIMTEVGIEEIYSSSYRRYMPSGDRELTFKVKHIIEVLDKKEKNNGP